MKTSNILLISAFGLILVSMVVFGFILKSQLLIPATEGNGNIIMNSIDIDDFDKINIKGNFKVNYIQDTHYYLDITTDENLHDLIKTEVENNELFIKAIKPVKSGKEILINVSSPSLSGITASASATFNAMNDVMLEDVSLACNASSSIIINGKFNDINVSQNASSKVTLGGQANSLFVASNAGGTVDAFELEVQTADIEANASTAVKVNTEELSVKATAGSTVFYIGNPALNNINLSSGSNLIKQD